MMGARGFGVRNPPQDQRVGMYLGELGLRLVVEMHIPFAYIACLVLRMVEVRMSLSRHCWPFAVVVYMEHLRLPLPPLRGLYHLLGEVGFSRDA